MAIKGIPLFAGNLAITLAVDDADQAARFYRQAFDAREIARYLVPCSPYPAEVKAVHLKIGQAVIHVAAANTHKGSDTADRCGHSHDHSHEAGPRDSTTPEALEGIGTVISLFFPNVDVALARAVAAGARLVQPAQDTPWGDRVALVKDPFGHAWGLASVTAELTVEEHNRRLADLAGMDGPYLEVRHT